MTYRERRMRRAERLRDWAEKRDEKAHAAFQQADQLADMIPCGQPILVGHYSEGRARRDQDRIHNGMRNGVEHQRTADRMREKAGNIEAAAGTAIYSDDPDAIDRLQERIAALEAERDMLKAYNKSCRAGRRDVSILTPAWQQQLRTLARVAAFQIGKHGEVPGYAITNLSGNINRLRKRLEASQ